MPDEIIKVSGLTKDYGSGRGVFGFDFTVRRGEVFGIVGTNGSGKTTTLRHLMGFLNPDSGSCEIMGMDCRREAREIMRHVGYVPGEIDFPDVGTGTSFLKIQAEFMGLKDRDAISRLVNLFKLDTDAPLRRMSKGMKQKTALVAAFMAHPEILLLDEPSTGLDPLMRDALIELILEEKARGTTVLMSTHIFKELDDTADRVLFIENGRQIELADMHTLRDQQPQRYRLGFNTQADLDNFAAATAFRIARKSPAHLHLDIEFPQQSVNELFREIGNYEMRYMKYRPFTLEDRYTEMIEKGGKINA